MRHGAAAAPWCGHLQEHVCPQEGEEGRWRGVTRVGDEALGCVPDGVGRAVRGPRGVFGRGEVGWEGGVGGGGIVRVAFCSGGPWVGG